jgi:8-oxo-dGTP pyrophosphatase MutT (NUDIX family)
MTIYGLRQRVACYVTRKAEHGRELLVFEQLDDDPDSPSGIQIPAGGMERFESVDVAALREVEEESGLTDVSFDRQLGAVERGVGDEGGPSITTYVHLTTSTAGEAGWEHRVTGDGLDTGMRFALRWEPLPLAIELAGGQSAYLDQVTP